MADLEASQEKRQTNAQPQTALPVTLTPGQTVNIHGWLTPKTTLEWQDVVSRPDLTFESLKKRNLTLRQLHTLQSNVEEWVRHGEVTLAHAPEMAELWVVHPVRDMRADLGDLIAIRWSAATLRKMGVTWADIRQLGAGPAMMPMFGFTLLGWQGLGFCRDDLSDMSDAEIAVTFGLTRQVAESCFNS
jgi:hypothetical protein